RFAHQRHRGEVQDGVEGPVRGEHTGGVRADLPVHELGAGGDRLTVTGGQIVEHHDLVAEVEQPGGDHAADIAGAAGDQDSHQSIFSTMIACERSSGSSNDWWPAAAMVTPSVSRSTVTRALGTTPLSRRPPSTSMSDWTCSASRRITTAVGVPRG